MLLLWWKAGWILNGNKNEVSEQEKQEAIQELHNDLQELHNDLQEVSNELRDALK